MISLDYELWVPAAGYEGRYEVSSLGRIKSLTRISMRSNGRPRPVSERILTPAPHYKTRRLQVVLEGKCWSVHRLVAESFLGPCPSGMQVCHWDDNPNNNCISNLRYGTGSDNMFDRVRNGLHWGAAKTHCKNGHEFSAINTYMSVTKKGNPTRVCKECGRRRAREFGRKKRAEKSAAISF